jgi:hypothetical protein
VGPRAGLDGCGKLASYGIRSPDRPARTESLYRLSYPGPVLFGSKVNSYTIRTQSDVYTHTRARVPHNIEMLTGPNKKQYWDSSECRVPRNSLHVPFCPRKP